VTALLLLIKAGIALGSLVAATLAYGVVLFLLAPIYGWLAALSPVLGPLIYAVAPTGYVSMLIVFVLGGLIYRDIVRRDPRLTGHAPA
jgi:hypothetical protein